MLNFTQQMGKRHQPQTRSATFAPRETVHSWTTVLERRRENVGDWPDSYVDPRCPTTSSDRGWKGTLERIEEPPSDNIFYESKIYMSTSISESGMFVVSNRTEHFCLFRETSDLVTSNTIRSQPTILLTSYQGRNCLLPSLARTRNSKVPRETINRVLQF